MRYLRLCVLSFSVVFFAGRTSGADINVYAAASISDALREVADQYEPLSGDKLHFNLGSSSALALQIKQGAPADVFFSADEAKMDALANAGLIVAETRRSLLSNTLVVVVNADGGAAISRPSDLVSSNLRRLALAETETVPAGIYAKQYLRQAGLWEKMAGRIVPTENVRACLAAVESGNVDAGIVYKTDALITKKVRVAYEISSAEGPNISYPVAVLSNAKEVAAGRKFTAYLGSPAALAVFKRYGFLVRH